MISRIAVSIGLPWPRCKRRISALFARSLQPMHQRCTACARFGQRRAGIDDEIGARALLGIGHLERRICANFSSVMPGRASTRSRWASAGAETTSTASTCSQPPFSNSSGMSKTTSGASRVARRETSLRIAPTAGWTMASSRFSASGSPNTAAPSFVPIDALVDRWCRETPPRSPATSAPPGPCSSCTAASASNTGTPSPRNIAATVDLPMPIEPVRPRMNGA